ncbi:Uncharacterised protein [Mycobacteroides abscessus subsp. abscessus]|nr:Uncharacterised protein [Mycobacteroides abscessus subsp. abscessus]
MPNMPAMPQATGERHTRPGAGPPAGRAVVSATSWPLRPRSTPSQGSAAAKPSRAHSPMEIRQPCESATGTAISAGTTVPICTMVM